MFILRNNLKKLTMKQSRLFHTLFLGVIGSLLMISAQSFAAAKPDFSGKWTLNESKSNMGEGSFMSAAKLSISQTGNTLTIDRTRTGRDGEERTTSETLTMDGKENINEGENRTTSTTVTWSDDGTSLIIKSKREFTRQGETFEMNSTETWTLAEGGKILSIKSESSSQRGDRTATLVYDKN